MDLGCGDKFCRFCSKKSLVHAWSYNISSLSVDSCNWNSCLVVGSWIPNFPWRSIFFVQQQEYFRQIDNCTGNMFFQRILLLHLQHILLQWHLVHFHIFSFKNTVSCSLSINDIFVIYKEIVDLISSWEGSLGFSVLIFHKSIIGATEISSAIAYFRVI